MLWGPGILRKLLTRGAGVGEEGGRAGVIVYVLCGVVDSVKTVIDLSLLGLNIQQLQMQNRFAGIE